MVKCDGCLKSVKPDEEDRVGDFVYCPACGRMQRIMDGVRGDGKRRYEEKKMRRIINEVAVEIKPGADLRGANLKNADLSGASLQGACLIGADLSRAYLIRADLRDADLCYAKLDCANLRGADLRGADLYGADLYGTYLLDAIR